MIQHHNILLVRMVRLLHNYIHIRLYNLVWIHDIVWLHHHIFILLHHYTIIILIYLLHWVCLLILLIKLDLSLYWIN